MNETHLISRYFKVPESSFFLFGPRGTGKSTFLRDQFPNALWLDLLQPENLRLYSAYPERLSETIAANIGCHDVIIDEVQKVPQLLDVVHSLVEQKNNLRFILTGSSARKLKRTGVNLLAGRALLKHFHPFMASELGDEFHLNQALEFGLLPLVYGSKNPSDALKTYAGLYLKEEVQEEGLVRNIGDFSRFLEVMSYSHGEILNVSNIARECLISRKIVDAYLGILEDLLLCHLLPVFTKRAQRQTIVHPKFYYFDSGVYNSLRGRGPLDKPTEIYGHALEGLVLQNLLAWNNYQDGSYQISYWRTKSGVEVDFILYGPNGFWAIEVKNSTNVGEQDVRSLSAFAEDYPEAKLLLLYRGTQKVKIKNILCLPVEDFLRHLRPGEITL